MPRRRLITAANSLLILIVTASSIAFSEEREDAQGWPTYESKDHHFSIEFPADSEAVESTTSLTVTANGGSTGQEYSVEVLPVPGVSNLGAEPIRIAMQGARDSVVKKLNGKLITDVEIVMFGRPGRSFAGVAAKDGEPVFFCCRIFIAGGRRFQLKIIQNGPTTVSLEMASKFFGSFQSTAEATDAEPEHPTGITEIHKPVPFDIQGMKIGDKLTKEFAYTRCPAKDKGKHDVIGREFIELNDGKVFVLYQFDDFKLIGVTLSFDADMFTTIVDVYTQKFGVPPHRSETEILKNRLNAEFVNVTLTWETVSGPFAVSKYGSSIDKGIATLHSPEYSAYLQRRRANDRKKLGKKL